MLPSQISVPVESKSIPVAYATPASEWSTSGTVVELDQVVDTQNVSKMNDVNKWRQMDNTLESVS